MSLNFMIKLQFGGQITYHGIYYMIMSHNIISYLKEKIAYYFILYPVAVNFASGSVSSSAKTIFDFVVFVYLKPVILIILYKA